MYYKDHKIRATVPIIYIFNLNDDGSLANAYDDGNTIEEDIQYHCDDLGLSGYSLKILKARIDEVEPTTPEIKAELEELRQALRDENISQGELIRLQELADYIEFGDVELLEPAGVPEGVKN